MIRALLIALLVVVLVAAGLVLALARGWLGEHQGPGQVTTLRRPAAEVAGRIAEQRTLAMRQGVSAPKQILFGDLHVHSTFSFDAFMPSLPASLIAPGRTVDPQKMAVTTTTSSRSRRPMMSTPTAKDNHKAVPSMTRTADAR